MIRLFCVPFIIKMLSSGNYYKAFFLLLSAIISDFLDGFIARRYNAVSIIGSILDPIVDKIFILSLYAYFYCKKAVPLWFFMSIFFKEITLLFLVLYYFFIIKKLIVIKPVWQGKCAMILHCFLTMYIFYQHIFFPNLLIQEFFFVIVAFFSFFALVVYAKKILSKS